ncbi:GlxA family transcriptional regulator [Rhizorhabdus argentea]|uniref:GlxA family transcriptional regulator n=1 Tax=Rhizorhabdus argentea TaxID=1387174 RepID=UPI0030EC8800
MLFKVGFVVFDRFQLHQVAGPLSIFEASSGYGVPGYDPKILSSNGGLVRASAGVEVSSISFSAAEQSDILFVTGGYGFRDAECSPLIADFIRSQGAQCRHICAVSTGPMVLAASGLLDGHRAATHWSLKKELAERYPSIDVCSDELIVRDRKFWTSITGAAVLEIAARIVEEDFGHDVAKRATRELMSFQRPGYGMREEASIKAFQALMGWARVNLQRPLSVEDLAERMGMAQRVFIPAFTLALGQTPAKAIERVRVEEALALLADPHVSVAAAAQKVGFVTSERMRRAFLRAFGVPPQEMRAVVGRRGQ